MKKIMLILAIMVSGGIIHAAPLDPMESLQKSIDEVISILKDPEYDDASKKELQASLIWNYIKQVFDFDKMGELSLGRFRKDFSDTQLAEFNTEFANLIGNTYLRRIQGEYRNEKVEYISQRIGEGRNADKASVETNIIINGKAIPVSYTLWLHNNVWRIYDVRVEGVSLVMNYRNQFQSVLTRNTPDYLIERIKKTNAQQAAGQEGDTIE